MRLLNTKSFELEYFSYDAIPRQYAILSHVWGDEEMRFSDVQEGRIKEPQNLPTKLAGCCRIAKDDGIEYIWADTLCIDSKNSVEVQEAINSMFRWYKNAVICYAFLSDIPADDKNPWDPNSKFSSSRWFERGWTLQELLAPPRLRFYNCEWHCLGTKGDLCGVLEKATGIPSPYLLGIKALRDASVAQRMSWAAKRVTKMPEDIAYSLLGIFDIAMSMIYGEGSKKAFTRLQELIMEEIGDDSILAWGLEQTESTLEPLTESLPERILASSPADFANCGHVQKLEHSTRDSFDKFGGSLRLHVPLFTLAPGIIFGLLKCGDSNRVVGIPLTNISSKDYIRPQGRCPILVPMPEAEISPTLILVRIEHEKRTLAASSRKYWFNVQGSIETGLELIDVEPRSCWRKLEALIEVAVTSQEDDKQRTFVRFRYKAGVALDFLVVLALTIGGSQSEAEAQCHVMTCARDTSLSVIARKYNCIRQEALHKQSASNGIINLQVFSEAVQKGTMFFLRMVPLASPPEITHNATVELQILDANVEITLLQQEESATEREVSTLKEAMEEKEKSRKQTEAELESVQRELSQIEAKRARLVMLLKEVHEESGSLDHSQKTTISRLDNLAKRRSLTQQCLESFLDTAVFTGSVENGDKMSEAQDRTPILSWAAKYGQVGVIRALLDMGVANIDLQSGSYKQTPLHAAAYHGHRTIVLMLLDYGANIESRNMDGETPLCYAVQEDNEKVIHLLIEKGANINTKDKNGQNPLFYAVQAQNEKNIFILIEKGADINAKDKSGQTPLFCAVAAQNEKNILILIEKGADINAKDNEGDTPLHFASVNRNENIAELLLRKGASITIGKQGVSPLHVAASSGNEAILKMFVKSSGAVHLVEVTKSGMSPLDYAVNNGHIGAEKLLLDAIMSLKNSGSGSNRISNKSLETSKTSLVATPEPINSNNMTTSPGLGRINTPPVPVARLYGPTNDKLRRTSTNDKQLRPSTNDKRSNAPKIGVLDKLRRLK